MSGAPVQGANPTRVKICGLRRMEDVSFVNECLPDYVGFVFAESKRQVTKRQAEALRAALDPQILAVGVFVNEEIGKIRPLCERGIIDLIQLHGDEDEEYLRELSGCVKTPIIRGVRVRSREQILAAEKSPCDYLLLDTYAPGHYGGGGQTFDGGQIPPLRKPWFLAGGLSPENVGEKIRKYHPFGVDVSSHVETDGKKDPEKIRAFIENVRGLK